VKVVAAENDSTGTFASKAVKVDVPGLVTIANALADTGLTKSMKKGVAERPSRSRFRLRAAANFATMLAFSN
jgi:hypothetical protein